MDIKETEKAAVAALVADAGSEKERAEKLVEAVKNAASVEALEVVAGEAQSFGSALDRRVAALDRMIQALSSNQRLPTAYEVGAIFRITPTQGRNVLRTYQARFSAGYRARLQSVLKSVKPRKELQGGTNTKIFVFDFDDPDVLDYAVEKLRRRGLTRSVTVDRTALELVVDREEEDRLGKDAEKALAE